MVTKPLTPGECGTNLSSVAGASTAGLLTHWLVREGAAIISKQELGSCGLIDDDYCVRMQLERGCGHHARHGPLNGACDRLRFCAALRNENKLPSLKNRAEPLDDAMDRNL